MVEKQVHEAEADAETLRQLDAGPRPPGAALRQLGQALGNEEET